MVVTSGPIQILFTTTVASPYYGTGTFMVLESTILVPSIRFLFLNSRTKFELTSFRDLVLSNRFQYAI